MSTPVNTVKSKAKDIVTYWNRPLKGRYMSFKEIGAYSFGGIGAYCLITLGTACLLATGNTLITGTLGIDPTDMYVMYVAAVLCNIPLTGIRANIIDNTRNKAGKYRPYILRMGIPTALICVAMVWFPYTKLPALLGEGLWFGREKAYVVKCAIIMLLNLLLHFFYYFFYDAYENLIHVLSPNSQERADVSSVKSIVYSLAPTLVNLFTPIIAQNIFHTNATDIRVYRLLYPVLCVIGILLCIVVYKNTEEKIVQARTHVVQVRFTDAVRAVAKNKYFWIISLAGWIGFLESAYSNIMLWLYNYGGACSGNQYGIIVTIYGNASLWGMLLAPFLIRKWGKKAVLVVTNLFNILFILMMLPVTAEINGMTIWLVLGCLYLNAFMGSFALILNPSIQADIRDYQQYVTGERIDGMFSAVGTIGTVITLATSAVLPFIYEKNGFNVTEAERVINDPAILSRHIGEQTVGQILEAQKAGGQEILIANNALYDPEILLNLLHVLIIFSAVGAAANVIPYFWYDFNERKQESVVRTLKIRAMCEDYSNGVLEDENLVEACNIIRQAEAVCAAGGAPLHKNSYRAAKGKAAKEQVKEREIAAFVMDEVHKFDTPLYRAKLAVSEGDAAAGLAGIAAYTKASVKAALNQAKAMPKGTREQKELRSAAVEAARSKVTAYRAYQKYYAGKQLFEEPDFAVLEQYFAQEDGCDMRIKELNAQLIAAKKRGDKAAIPALKQAVTDCVNARKEARRQSESEMDKHAFFNRAAKPYLNAVKLLKEAENYRNFDTFFALYNGAVARLAQEGKVPETAEAYESDKAE